MKSNKTISIVIESNIQSLTLDFKSDDREFAEVILSSMPPDKIEKCFDFLVDAGFDVDYIMFFMDGADTKIFQKSLKYHPSMDCLRYYFCGDSGDCLSDVNLYFNELLAHGYGKYEILKSFGDCGITNGKLFTGLLDAGCTAEELMPYMLDWAIVENFDAFLDASINIDSILAKIGIYPKWYFSKGIRYLLDRGANPEIVLQGIISLWDDISPSEMLDGLCSTETRTLKKIIRNFIDDDDCVHAFIFANEYLRFLQETQN